MQLLLACLDRVSCELAFITPRPPFICSTAIFIVPIYGFLSENKEEYNLEKEGNSVGYDILFIR
jgi:hypothetical protein